MLDYCTSKPVWSDILEHFRARTGHGRRRDLDNITCHLLQMILARHDFDDIDALIVFCEDPANLGTWLPCESDRVVFSSGLVEGLRKFCSVPA